jgi:hypothetical protein
MCRAIYPVLMLATIPAERDEGADRESLRMYERALEEVRETLRAEREASRASWSGDLKRLASDYFDGDLR